MTQSSNIKEQFIARLRNAAAHKENNLKIRAISSERILVQIRDHAYLISIPATGALQTPGRIAQRVSKWPRFRQRVIRGHLILSKYADLSAQVISSDGANIPRRVAVVGKWGEINRLVGSLIDQGMAHLLELAGVTRADVRRTLKKPVASSPPTATHAVTQSVPAKASSPRNLQRGMRLDSYQLVERLGRGHSAEVWRATVSKEIPGVDLAIGTTVAIKIYNAFLLQGFQPLRVQREFTVAAEIQHENLARVHDLLLSPSRPFHSFMVMEYVEGSTLKSVIEKHGKLSFKQCIEIAAQLFAALKELHSAGAVHRDVKAANIMVAGLNPIKIKLVDLGIVSIPTEDNLTQASQFLGSKHSAPFEQLTGATLDERTDIYGAGSVLYHCMQGSPMYHGTGPEGAIVVRMMSNPQTLAVQNYPSASFDRGFAEFVNRCIAVRPNDRPASAEACLRELTPIAIGVNTP